MPTPILDALIESGSVFVEDGYLYVGIASDGTECYLPGNTGKSSLTENYLSDFPTPDKW